MSHRNKTLEQSASDLLRSQRLPGLLLPAAQILPSILYSLVSPQTGAMSSLSWFASLPLPVEPAAIVRKEGCISVSRNTEERTTAVSASRRTVRCPLPLASKWSLLIMAIMYLKLVRRRWMWVKAVRTLRWELAIMFDWNHVAASSRRGGRGVPVLQE